MKLRLFILSLFLACSFPGFPQQIQFFGEDLHFKYSRELFEVEGLYYFRNLTGKEVRQVLFYPFPDTEKYGDISYISVHPENDTTSMLATQSEKGSLFKLLIPPEGEVAYHIAYGQKVKNGNAKYIITTTQQWAQPFEFARYDLTFPDTLAIRSVSIPPDTISNDNGSIVYRWEREDFMPEKDFEFNFRSE